MAKSKGVILVVGKSQPAKYHFCYLLQYDCLINTTHKTHSVYI